MHAAKFAARLAQAFHLTDAPTLAPHPGDDGAISATELRSDASHPAPAGPLPEADALLVCVHLRDIDHSETWADGRPRHAAPIRAGTCTVQDLRQRVVVRHDGPYHFLGVVLPAGDAAGPDKSRSRSRPAADTPARADPVLAGLAASLLPFMDGRLAHHERTVGHALRAFAAHVAQTRCVVDAPAPACRGGLAPWQQRRARDLLRLHLAEGIALDPLAAACGLSRSGFVRAFRESFGVPPHQWLLRCRVDRALELMQDDRTSLSEIAVVSGFFDQSHFTRAFSQRMGLSPGAWRRAHRAALAAPADPRADEPPRDRASAVGARLGAVAAAIEP